MSIRSIYFGNWNFPYYCLSNFNKLSIQAKFKMELVATTNTFKHYGVILLI